MFWFQFLIQFFFFKDVDVLAMLMINTDSDTCCANGWIQVCTRGYSLHVPPKPVPFLEKELNVPCCIFNYGTEFGEIKLKSWSDDVFMGDTFSMFDKIKLISANERISDKPLSWKI